MTASTSPAIGLQRLRRSLQGCFSIGVRGSIRRISNLCRRDSARLLSSNRCSVVSATSLRQAARSVIANFPNESKQATAATLRPSRRLGALGAIDMEYESPEISWIRQRQALGKEPDLGGCRFRDRDSQARRVAMGGRTVAQPRGSGQCASHRSPQFLDNWG